MRRTNYRKFNKLIILGILVLVIFSVICFAGCTGTQESNKEKSDIEQGTVVAEEVVDKCITITDDYSFTLPDGFLESEEEFNEGILEAHFFMTEDGKQQIRSFSTYDPEFTFPDDVEEISEDPEAEIGYGGLYDTAIARITDTVKSNEGSCVYRKIYVWPDGADYMCFIEVVSFDENFDDLADEIRSSIYNCHCDADYECDTNGIVDYNQPSQEEIDNAMLQEAQDAYDDYVNGQMDDGYHVFPYF